MPSNLQASVASAQFDRIDELVERKQSILHQYKEGLSSLPGVELNLESAEVYNGAWATTMVLDGDYSIDGEELRAALDLQGIASRPFFYPMSSVPAYKKYLANGRAENPLAYKISERGVTLPSHYLLEEKQIAYITEVIGKILRDS
jgi:perosamine synthetase